MPIFVNIARVEYKLVLEYYNIHKKDGEPPLEILNRAEGGFMIQIPEMQYERCNNNEKIRQLRWSRRWLVPLSGFPYFTDEQELLLVDALKSVYGDSFVQHQK